MSHLKGGNEQGAARMRNNNRQVNNNTEIRISNFNQTVGSGGFNNIVKGLV